MKSLIFFVLLCFAFSSFSCAQTKTQSNSSENVSTNKTEDSTLDQQKAREFSDKVVKALIENQQKELRQMGEQVMRNSVSEKDFKVMLEKVFSTYGKPLEVKFKSDSLGYRVYEDGKRKPVRKFWYSVQTTKNEDGQYLFTEIVPDDESLAFATFAIVTFPQGIPPELK